jgi:hypothetical protein
MYKPTGNTADYTSKGSVKTSALVIAAANGIMVELMLPAASDSYIVQHASFSFIKPLLQRGC